ncbi:MAG: molybdate ABC transporter substrate-binding protein [Trueperaceae bacterium]|nr:MAG: molybdate ABC transporter substrate-binding protein [Trueperaceae bacterium]
MKVVLTAALFFFSHLCAAQSLTIFAASSLTNAFTAIAKAFEISHPNVEIVLHFAGSSTLATQLLQGAQADLFASADAWQMERVVGADLAQPSTTPFTTNRLVILVPEDSTIDSWQDLKDPGTLLVLAAPEVPAGSYARTLIDDLNQLYGQDYPAAVLANVVSFEPNVRQSAAKVALGEADAAVVYHTDAQGLVATRSIDPPAPYHLTAEYWLVPLDGSQHPELAGSWIDFVHSETGQSILVDFGFSAPP